MSLPVLKHGEIIAQDARSTISTRYHTVTQAINREFWNSQSETQNSLYVASYGRGTAIDTSDLDILVELPQSEYTRYDYAKGNGQSRLLQAVRSSIMTAYPRSDVRADGQVVKVNFSDGMRFEILPAFKKVIIKNDQELVLVVNT
jgi:predicted nucleotidyltransferase